MAVIYIIVVMVICYEILGMEGYVLQLWSYLVSYLSNYLITYLCGWLVFSITLNWCIVIVIVFV